MSEDQMVTIEVDGRELKAKAGAMLIEVTDAAGIHIPRFCYHEKLSVAANCRMCLVEVERVPKPLPACATPVNDGMKVHTRSPLALAAQKGTMEFLLINHPLDCPICDQGGECELQDVAVGYGADVSRFVEGKRVVTDRDIGPLIATDFTRCIHCTRCVRFGAEIAGLRELGATGRGEHMHIGTYVEKSIDSELSGNVIDICPVGALTAKPSRFTARAWELVQRDGIAPHDAVGSNIHLHIRRNRVMRVHPKSNEAVNECWISDRDRFSYQGLYSDDRLTRPAVKRDGAWVDVEWQEALDVAAKGLKGVPAGRIGALLSPGSTLEELYLAQKLVRSLGSDNVDHRLRQADFRGDAEELCWLGCDIASLEALDGALLIGAQPRTEQPILGHRLRKAAMKGAAVTYVNPLYSDLNYPAEQIVNTPAGMVDDLAAIARALGAGGELIDGAQPGSNHQAVADRLRGAEKGAVLLGGLAVAHPDFSLLRYLAGKIAAASTATLGVIPQAANSVGACLAGAVPGTGFNAAQMVEQPLDGYLLMGVEPDRDFWDPASAMAALEGASCVVSLSAYRTPALDAAADVLLPVAVFAETSGTFVNGEGRWQSFAGAVSPLGEARPAWKVLRVLGNLVAAEGFEQCSSEEVRQELMDARAGAAPENRPASGLSDSAPRSRTNGMMRIGDVPIYAADPLVRRADALQATTAATQGSVRMSRSTLEGTGLAEGGRASVEQDGRRTVLPVAIDDSVPDGCVRIQSGVAGSDRLGGQFGEVTLEKA